MNSSPVTTTSALCSSLPVGSHLGQLSKNSYYRDSYAVPIDRVELSLLEIYLAIFDHVPWYGKLLLILRNAMVTPLGLRNVTPSEVWKPQRHSCYQVGDLLVRFTLYFKSDKEIVTGINDKHMDFRVSAMRLIDGDAEKIIVTTIVCTHNLLGRIYIGLIRPFHQFGLKKLLSNAKRCHRF